MLVQQHLKYHQQNIACIVVEGGRRLRYAWLMSP